MSMVWKKNRPHICAAEGDFCHIQVKGWKKPSMQSGSQKARLSDKTDVFVLYIDQTDFKSKAVKATRDDLI